MSSSVLSLNSGCFMGTVMSCNASGWMENSLVAMDCSRGGVTSEGCDRGGRRHTFEGVLDSETKKWRYTVEEDGGGRTTSGLPGLPSNATRVGNHCERDDKGSEQHSSGVGPSSAVAPLLKMVLYKDHRLRRFRQLAIDLQSPADASFYYQLMMWAYNKGIFIHPSLRGRRCYSAFRDHQFYVSERVKRLTPLLAIPEALLIGFLPLSAAALEERNNLYDEKKEKEFNQLNAGESSAADICSFFFNSLSMVVSDLVTARGSPLTDSRHVFAEMLSKVRTLQNAPFFDNDVVLDRSSEEMGLADVLLQMIRNYVNAGPLVNKVSREDLMWLVSVCLSHCTPLTLGPHTSIGIVPMLHLFPHGGKMTNSFVVARRTEGSHLKMARFIRRRCGLDFSLDYDGRWVYLVPERTLEPGEEVLVQAMAPVCDSDVEADQMWRLSCGATPDHYLTSREVERKRRTLQEEMVQRGADHTERRGKNKSKKTTTT